jgi:hypothetical protein
MMTKHHRTILHTSILTAANPGNLKFDPHGIASFLRYYNQGFRVLPFSDFSPNSQLCGKQAQWGIISVMHCRLIVKLL